MAAPKGNKNAAGNIGGGRKSAYQEKADYELLEKMFMGEIDRAKIQAKLDNGRYSLKDMFISKALAGNERILSEIFRKLFPDKKEIDLESKLLPIPILAGLTQKTPPIYGGLSALEKTKESE